MRVIERPQPRPKLAPRVLTLGGRPVSLGSSPMTTSIAAPARKPVTTAFDRKLAIQPNRKSAINRNSSPVANAIAATSCAACSRRGR